MCVSGTHFLGSSSKISTSLQMATDHTKEAHPTWSHGVLCMEHAWPQGTKKNSTSIRTTRTLAPRVSRACFHLPAVPGYLQKPGVHPHAQHAMIAMMMTMTTELPCSCWASVSSCDPYLWIADESRGSGSFHINLPLSLMCGTDHYPHPLVHNFPLTTL